MIYSWKRIHAQSLNTHDFEAQLIKFKCIDADWRNCLWFLLLTTIHLFQFRIVYRLFVANSCHSVIRRHHAPSAGQGVVDKPSGKAELERRAVGLQSVWYLDIILPSLCLRSLLSLSINTFWASLIDSDTYITYKTSTDNR